MKIEYVKGDATSPSCEGNKIIVHVSNDVGGWGRGFVLAISAKWNGIPPIRYAAVAMALDKIADKALELTASVHMPRIGCGLAGGTWDKMEEIVLEKLTNKGIEVTVYDL